MCGVNTLIMLKAKRRVPSLARESSGIYDQAAFPRGSFGLGSEHRGLETEHSDTFGCNLVTLLDRLNAPRSDNGKQVRNSHS